MDSGQKLKYYIPKIIKYLVLVCISIAVISGLSFALNYNNKEKTFVSYGIAGNPFTIKFTGKNAARYFMTGVSRQQRVRFFNGGSGVYGLKLLLDGQSYGSQIQIPQGVTEVRIKSEKSPVHIEFQWDRQPDDIFMFPVETDEMRWFLRTVYIASFLSLVYALLCLYMKRKISVIPDWSVAVIFFGIALFVFSRATVPLIGDEAHYMLMAESLVNDGDLNMRNNVLSNTHYIYASGLTDIHETKSGNPVHYPLLPVILTPAFIGATFGLQTDPYTMSKFLVIALMTLSTVFIFRTVKEAMDGSILFFLLAVFFTGLPWLSYSNQIYPEAIAALLIFFSSRIIFFISPTKGHLLFTSFLVALLPFVHIKYSITALLLGVGLLIKSRDDFRNITPVALLPGAGFFGILFYNLYIYENIFGPYGGDKIPVTYAVIKNYIMYYFDADKGLFSLSPLLLWSISGLVYYFRKDRYRATMLVMVIISAHLPNITHFILGECPYGRYWVAVFPLLIYFGVYGFASLMPNFSFYTRIIFASLTVLLAGLTILQSFSFIDMQAYFYPHMNQSGIAAAYFKKLTGLQTDWIFPHFPYADSFYSLVFWVILAFIFMSAGILTKKGEDITVR